MIPSPETWLASATHAVAPGAARHLPGLLRDAGLRAGVVLLGRDAAATLGRHLLTLQHGWPGGAAPWSEILVADLGSRDATAELARSGGADFLPPSDPRAASLAPPAHGEGLRRALRESTSDLLLVLPADLVRIDLDAAAALVTLLAEHPETHLVQAFESRPGPHPPHALRHLLAILAPELAAMAAPDNPFLALRTSEIRNLPLAATAGYEPALVVDLWARHGLGALRQVRIPSLEWEASPEGDPAHGFRSTLALLEALQRAGRLRVPDTLGHLLPTIEETTEGRLVEHTRLEIFPWLPPPGGAPPLPL